MQDYNISTVYVIIACPLFNEFKPSVVVHLAAVSHANRSNKDPHSTFDHSLRTLENSLDNSRGLVDHFIFLSSSMVYGNFKKNIVNELCTKILFIKRNRNY